MDIPFFERIAKARRLLVAGIGGGFDIVGGIPIYLDLRRDRTRDSELFINPLMGFFWAFELDAVVHRMEFAGRIEATHSKDEVARQFRVYRVGVRRRGKKACRSELRRTEEPKPA